MHDLTPGNVGDCVEDQAFADNGDAQQHTTKGLLVWRKLDNWTAFTNGYQTWLNGPTGLVNRLNTQRFSWEADYNAAGVQKIIPPLATIAPNSLAWTVVFDHNLVLPSVTVDGKPLPPKGHWVNVYFRVRNNKSTPAALSTTDVSIGDSKHRTYTSPFEIRQVDQQGQETPFSGTVPANTATPLLRLTFDVALDATGGVMHVAGGNDVAVV
ncbi:MAG: hypothetical protein ACR2IK_21580 [Chloroflexota bacterium]